MTEEKICDIIDKLLNRKTLLEKKKKLWGLNKEESKELNKVKFDYMKYYFRLIDEVFINYIEPFLFTDDIIDLKQEILSKSNWEGNLLFDDNEIDEFLNSVDNIKEVQILLNILKEEEILMARDFEKDKVGEELIEMFGELNNVNSEDSIVNYIELRYEMMIGLLEMGGDIYE